MLKLIMEERISAIASKDIIEEYEEILARLQYRHDYLWWRDTYCLSQWVLMFLSFFSCIDLYRIIAYISV